MQRRDETGHEEMVVTFKTHLGNLFTLLLPIYICKLGNNGDHYLVEIYIFTKLSPLLPSLYNI